jgi:hypothetical protein
VFARHESGSRCGQPIRIACRKYHAPEKMTDEDRRGSADPGRCTSDKNRPTAQIHQIQLFAFTSAGDEPVRRLYSVAEMIAKQPNQIIDCLTPRDGTRGNGDSKILVHHRDKPHNRQRIPADIFQARRAVHRTWLKFEQLINQL